MLRSFYFDEPSALLGSFSKAAQAMARQMSGMQKLSVHFANMNGVNSD